MTVLHYACALLRFADAVPLFIEARRYLKICFDEVHYFKLLLIPNIGT